MLPSLMFAVALVLGPPAQDLTPEENRALLLLSEFQNLVAAKGEEVWPGFGESASVPVAFFTPGGRAVLVGHPHPPEDAVPAGWDSEFGLDAAITGDTAGMFANTSINYHGSPTSIVSLPSLSSSSRSVGLIAHEVFHTYQARWSAEGGRLWPSEDARLTSRASRSAPLNNALGNIEGRLLQRALVAREDEEARELTGRFLAVRALRRLFLDGDVIAFEDGLELNEGLAEYAGMKCLLEGGADDHAPLDRFTEAGFSYPSWEEFARDELAELELIHRSGRGGGRKSFYHTGLAQGLLLDRFDPGWKHPFLNTLEPLSELLARAVDRDENDSLAVLAETLERFSFRDLLERERTVARRSEQEAIRLLEETLTGGALRVIFDLSPPAPETPAGSFDPMNLTSIPGGAKVHTRMLRVDGPQGPRLAFDRPVAQFERRRLYALAADGLGSVRLDGVAQPLDRGDFDAEFEQVRVEHARFDASGGAGRVSLRDDVLVLRFGAGGRLDWEAYADLVEMEPGTPPRDEPPSPADTVLPMVADSRTVSLPGDYRGTPFCVLVFSAAPWAKPSHTYFDRVASALRAREHAPGVAFVAVASQNGRTQAKHFHAEHPASFPVLFDGDRAFADRWKVTNFPVVLEYDEAGELVATQEGLHEAALEALIDRLTAR